MTRRIRKSISIDKFMKLWQNAQEKKWDKVLPNWDIETSQIFMRELSNRFRTSKAGGSYGHLWDPQVADMMWAMAARSSSPMTLSTVGYRASYAKKYPIAWVRSGQLRDEITTLIHGMPIKGNKWGIEIGIPTKTVTYDEEPWKDVPPDDLGYFYLEKSRSYIASSLLLSWPAVIKKTLELIGS